MRATKYCSANIGDYLNPLNVGEMAEGLFDVFVRHYEDQCIGLIIPLMDHRCVRGVNKIIRNLDARAMIKVGIDLNFEFAILGGELYKEERGCVCGFTNIDSFHTQFDVIYTKMMSVGYGDCFWNLLIPPCDTRNRIDRTVTFITQECQGGLN